MSIYLGYGYGMPKVVKRLLIANIAVFVFTAVMVRWQVLIYNLFGFVPVLVTHRFMIWQFFTYMFLHGSIGHIFMNMLVLWMFGSELEYNWGSKDFFIYYITCGVGGALLVWLTSFTGLSSASSPTIGASGAIFGLLVAFGLMWPDRLIYIWGIFPIKALHLVLIFGAMDLFSGLTGTGGRIAVFAHIGGGVTGFIYLKFGWRMMIHLEAFANRMKRRKFTVIDGGASRSRDRSDTDDTDDDSSHPDLQDEVDRILDKIAREGMDSLNDRERRILERASNKRRR